MKDLALAALRVFIVVALGFLLLTQVVVLPWLAHDQAVAAPELAFLQAPLLALCIAGVACVQVVLVCTWHLLTMTAEDEVFSDRARRWVDVIIGALATGGLLGLGTSLWLGSVPGVGPITVTLAPIMAGAASGAAALLMTVMRALLTRATAQNVELEQTV